MSKIYQNILRLLSCTYHILCVLGLMFILSSCGWHEAKEVIITADSLDQTEHVVYDDTAAIAGVIRTLDNPVGWLFCRNTLGKAYYYMGRNYSLSNQIAAADCYIEADRLQIDDPIYRGRVNSCMGYICAQNNTDSLALVFYERASEHFQKSNDKWYYAQTLLDRSEFNINLHHYDVADTLLLIAKGYQLDSAYQARYYETMGLYFYEQQQYDSALVYFNQGLKYWQSEADKSFSYLKIMQTHYLEKKDFPMVIHYANLIVEYSNNPNHLANAYYCLLLEAKENNDINQLSQITHARTDALKLLRDNTNKYAEAIPKLMEHVQNPHPWRWIRIVLVSFLVLCVILILSIFTYRKHTIAKIQVSEKRITNLSVQVQEHQYKLQEQSKLQYYKKHLDKIRRKYPKPLNRWNEYAELKKDIQPYLHNWFISLEKLDLTNREKVFCVISFIYPQMATEDLANYLCITKEALHVRKNRIAKKLSITSVELGVFLQKLANRE